MEKQNPLLTSVQYLKGVGPKRANLLAKIGVTTVHDLMTYYPRDYEDRSRVRQIVDLQNDERAVITGKVQLADILRFNNMLSAFKVAITDSTGIIYATCFRRFNYRFDVYKKLREDFKPGNRVTVYGKVTNQYAKKEITIEEYDVMRETVSKDFMGILPVYDCTEGVDNRFLRSITKQALDKYANYLIDMLPDSDRQKYGFMSVGDAARQVHYPASFEQKDSARKRLAYDEFLLLELAMSISKRQYTEKKKNQAYEIKRHLLTPFKHNLGFEFTQSQKKVIKEIFTGLQNTYPMNRLLLGDVGSGKTVVALSAVLLAIENGYQAAFMAPTEILAEQHFVTIKRFLNGLDVKVEMLSSATPKKEKKDIIDRLVSGDVNLLIGTHSIIEDDVRFKNLSLIVIDEQHKFGVGQREKLLKKGQDSSLKLNPDMLIMTATPIPRTLALTMYGDLDISVLTELPPNRQPIRTEHVAESYAYDFVKKDIKTNNHQVYIVYPLVDESNKIELKSAVKEWELLTKDVFFGYKVGLLHGQLPGKQKEKIMTEFSEGKYDILITTSVIEVGIDVPNATLMVIHHAERFGLATLHQLRGRIGRGKDRSTCYIIGDPKTEDAQKRFDTFTSTTDGFKIAETDLEIRGPGDFFGTDQSGLLDLKIGNIVTDIELILQARKHADEILQQDRFLTSMNHNLLRTELVVKYSGKFNLPQIR
jgi:ATP-dependent DNA helicase RecG